MVDESRMLALLEHVDLFAGLPRKSLENIARQMRESRWDEGATIVEEDTGGELGRMYVVLSGTARGEVQGQEVGRYGPGDYFGEMSMLDGEPRSATVTATSDLHLAGLASFNFKAILQSEPTIAIHLVKVLAQRLREANRRQLAG